MYHVVHSHNAFAHIKPTFYITHFFFGFKKRVFHLRAYAVCGNIIFDANRMRQTLSARANLFGCVSFPWALALRIYTRAQQTNTHVRWRGGDRLSWLMFNMQNYSDFRLVLPHGECIPYFYAMGRTKNSRQQPPPPISSSQRRRRRDGARSRITPQNHWRVVPVYDVQWGAYTHIYSYSRKLTQFSKFHLMLMLARCGRLQAINHVNTLPAHTHRAKGLLRWYCARLQISTHPKHSGIYIHNVLKHILLSCAHFVQMNFFGGVFCFVYTYIHINLHCAENELLKICGWWAEAYIKKYGF